MLEATTGSFYFLSSHSGVLQPYATGFALLISIPVGVGFLSAARRLENCAEAQISNKMKTGMEKTAIT
jgi:hypothetical protein